MQNDRLLDNRLFIIKFSLVTYLLWPSNQSFIYDMQLIGQIITNAGE
jgi:hypothetical protein